MLDEKKIKLMTKIAIYEKKESKDLEIASKSFKVDYVTLQMLYTAVATTIGYFCIVVLYILGNLERLLLNAGTVDFPKLIGSGIRNYVICLIVFLVIALFFYSQKYDKAFDKVKKDFTNLKNLSKLIEK